MKYQKVNSVVEARQHDSETSLVVVSDALGEQLAKKGDWLLGEEPRKITVVEDAVFQLQYEPYLGASDELQKESDDLIEGYKTKIDELEAENAKLQAAVDDLTKK